MGPFQLGLLFTLCLYATLNRNVYCSEQSFIKLSINENFIRKHFLKRRIPYNPNSTASFQLELLHAGDVHPNPGPDRDQDGTVPSFAIHRDPPLQRRIHYSPGELLQWRSTKLRLSSDVRDVIHSFGIQRRKTRRGRRGSRRRNCLRQSKVSRSSSSSSPNLLLCSMNVRSVRNKSALIHDFICDSNADLITMTETWLTDNDSTVLNEFVPSGYKLVHRPRSIRRGGGTGLVYRETINALQATAGEHNSFEYAEYQISSKSYQLCVINIYRPPYSALHPVSVSCFLSEFNDYIQSHLLSNVPLLIVGDFNIHVDSSSGDSQSFVNLLESLCCTQLVDFCTHIHGHTLDLLIRRQSDDNIVIGKPQVHSSLISDHIPVMCYLNSSKPRLPVKEVSFRRLSAVNTELLRKDLTESRLCDGSPSDVTELAMLYDTTLNDILDKHAPKATRTFVLRPKAPWLTDSILEEKRKKRKAEKIWMKSKTDKDWKAFKSIRNSYSFSLYEARKSHHEDLVSEYKENTKALFNIVKGLLNMSNKQPVIPCNADSKSFVDNLGKFFIDKV